MEFNGIELIHHNAFTILSTLVVLPVCLHVCESDQGGDLHLVHLLCSLHRLVALVACIKKGLSTSSLN